MTFWFYAIVMVTIAIALVLIPLWRARPAVDVSRDGINADIFRERLAELDKERQEGGLDDEQYGLLRQELERTLLVDIPETKAVPTHTNPQLMRWAVRAALGVPVLALVYYYGTAYRDGAGDWIELRNQWLGIVELATQQPGILPAEAREDLLDFTRVLQAQVAREGMRKPNSLYLLGRSYLELGYLDGALQMLARAHTFDPRQPEIMLAYAQARVMANEGRLDETSSELLQKVLAVAPDHQGALMLLGFAAMNSGVYQQTIDAWQRLLNLRDPTSEGAQVLRNGIARAQELLAEQQQASVVPTPTTPTPTTDPSEGPQLEVTVDLSPALRERLTSEDTLFIFAKAAQGPPMPLAAVRQPARDFPVQVVLDDSQAMMPSLKLSTFPEVIVSARISKAGDVVAQTGDLQGSSEPLKLNGGTQNVALMIDQIVP